MTPQKKRKIVILALILSGFALVLGSSNTFLYSTLLPIFQTLLSPETFEWKTILSPEGDLTFESPLKINWTKRDDLIEGKGFHSQFGICRANPAGFSISVSSIHFVQIDPPRDSKKLQEDYLQSLHAELGFSFKSKPVTCSGMPATLVTGAYQYGLQPQYFSYLIVTHKRWNWTLNILHDNSDKFADITQRAVGSVKVSFKDP